jgi:hypothetical protein
MQPFSSLDGQAKNSPQPVESGNFTQGQAAASPPDQGERQDKQQKDEHKQKAGQA